MARGSGAQQLRPGSRHAVLTHARCGQGDVCSSEWVSHCVRRVRLPAEPDELTQRWALQSAVLRQNERGKRVFSCAGLPGVCERFGEVVESPVDRLRADVEPRFLRLSQSKEDVRGHPDIALVEFPPPESAVMVLVLVEPGKPRIDHPGKLRLAARQSHPKMRERPVGNDVRHEGAHRLLHASVRVVHKELQGLLHHAGVARRYLQLHASSARERVLRQLEFE